MTARCDAVDADRDRARQEELLAGELAERFPELVVTAPDGSRRVEYLGLIGPMFETLRELDAELEARVARLERTS